MPRYRTLNYFFILFIVVVYIFSILRAMPSADTVPVQAFAGIAILYNIDMENHIAIIDNGWESYFNHLYAPQDFAQGTITSPALFSAPTHGHTVQYGTHRIRLALAAGVTYGLSFRSIDYATRVFINGKEIDNIGVVADTSENTVPRVDTKYYYFTSDTNTTELILQFANFQYVTGGAPPKLLLSHYENIVKLTQKNLYYDCIIGGCLVMACLFYLGMFFIYKQKQEFLYFSICCLALAIRSPQLIPLFFPRYNWYILTRLEFILLIIAFIMIALFVRKIYSTLLSKRAIYCYCIFSSLCIAVILFSQPFFIARLYDLFQVITALNFLYCIICIGLVLKNRQLTDTLAFGGLLTFWLFAFNDILARNNLPNFGTSDLTQLGMMVFLVAYMLILSIEFEKNERNLFLIRQNEEQITADNINLSKLSQLKTEFLADVAHELKTPLTVISNYAQLSRAQIAHQAQSEEDLSENLRMIAMEAQRMALVVNQLLDVAKLEEGRMEWNKDYLDLYVLVQEVADVYQPLVGKNANTLLLDVPIGLPLVYAEAARIKQVFINLISNAAKHTKNGIIKIKARQKDEYIEVLVIDSGEGIAPERLPHLFERFQYRDAESKNATGTGLGLYICKNIIEAHGGEIFITSQPQRGTQVYFTLYYPVIDEKQNSV